MDVHGLRQGPEPPVAPRLSQQPGPAVRGQPQPAGRPATIEMEGDGQAERTTGCDAHASVFDSTKGFPGEGPERRVAIRGKQAPPPAYRNLEVSSEEDKGQTDVPGPRRVLSLYDLVAKPVDRLRAARAGAAGGRRRVDSISTSPT